MTSKPYLFSIEDAHNLKIEDVWDLYKKFISKSQVSLIGSFGFGKELVERAEGCFLYTSSGKKLLDLTGGIGVLNHGHNHPEVMAARAEFAAANRMEVHKNFFSPYTAVLARNVAEIMPGDLNISYFPNSGAEAVEGAVKLAYKFHHGRRKVILHSDISFHGKLLGASSLTGSPELHFNFPQIPGVSSFAYGDISSLRSAVDSFRNSDGSSNIFAVIIEPLNASSMRQCSESFLREARALCSELGIVLIFDEVYTGWGKTGYLFNFMRCPDLVPDIVTYAKSFGGGKASISGYTTREEIFRQAYDNLRDATLHSTTYYGFGEEAITAIQAINTIFDHDLISRSQEIGEKFSRGLQEISKNPNVLHFESRGSGALWGLVLEKGVLEKILSATLKLIPTSLSKDQTIAKKVILGAIINRLYEDHSIVTYYGSNFENPLIISFPLIAGDEEVEQALTALEDCLSRSLVSQVAKFVTEKLKVV